VLSGGANRGALEVGALFALMEHTVELYITSVDLSSGELYVFGRNRSESILDANGEPQCPFFLYRGNTKAVNIWMEAWPETCR
jgi:hypothetical protein